MKQKNVVKALQIIAKSQLETAPVKLKVGYTDSTGFVNHNEIVILDCPAATIIALHKAEFVVDMNETAGGLVLDDYMMK